MKRLLHSRYAGLFAAFLLLLVIAAFFTWLTPRLPSAPRAVVQLGYHPHNLIFSPNERFVAVSTGAFGPGREETRLYLCDLEAGTHTLLKRGNDTDSIEFSPDGSRLTNGLTIWDVKTGGAVALKPDGWKAKRFAREQYDRESHRLIMQVWELTPGFEPELQYERQFIAKAWAIAPDLTTAATVITFSSPFKFSWVQLWDLKTGVEKARYLDANAEATIDKVLFTRQGQYLVGKYRQPDETSLAPLILDVKAGLEEVRLFAVDGERLHGDRWDMCVDDNKRWGVLTPAARGAGDRWMLCADKNGADVWDMLRRQKQLSLWSPADKNIYWRSDHYSFSDDGRYLLVTGFTATRTDWSGVFASGRWGTIDTTETYPVGRLWDVDRGEEMATFEDCSWGKLSPDGTTVATVDGNRVRFWDVPPRRYNLTLSLTVLTWGLTLLVVWVVKRRFRRRRDASQRRKTREPAA
jgi:hypothetical protein